MEEKDVSIKVISKSGTTTEPALANYDSYRTETLPANLIQAQRDYFGANTYERIDKDGHFHTDWSVR